MKTKNHKCFRKLNERFFKNLESLHDKSFALHFGRSNSKNVIKNNFGSLTSFNDYLNSKEAASYLKITEATLRNMCSNGQLVYYKLGRRNRFLKNDLDSIMSRVNGKDKRYGN